MKKIIATILALAMIFMCSTSLAEYPVIWANPVFISGGVICDSTMYTEFSASTKVASASIYVSSCSLQKKNGSNWEHVKSLTAPSKIAINAKELKAYADYNGECGSGTYRIKAVFTAGEATMTCYSNQRTFN